MYHVCIFTSEKYDSFALSYGANKDEVMKNLQLLNQNKFPQSKFNLLVVFKSFLMVQEGEMYYNYALKMDQRELKKLVISENETFSDQAKHLK